MLQWWRSLILGKQFSGVPHHYAANKPDARTGLRPRVIRSGLAESEGPPPIS